MKLVAVIVLTIFVLFVLFTVVRALLGNDAKQWELVERSQDEVVIVVAKRGSEELMVGAVPFGAEDFEYQIEELRSKGRQRLIALRGD